MAQNTELQNLLEGVRRLLIEQKRIHTITIDNRGSTRGKLYTISLATKEQALNGTYTQMLFCGVSSEVIDYLQGMRDILHYFQKN